MGRGRGRGRGRPHNGRKRGRGGIDSNLSRKDATHIRQFGERHPSQDLGRDFGPQSAKRGKFDRGSTRGGFSRGRGRGSHGRSSFYQTESNPPGNDNSSETESSDGEDETTPYNELLSVFTGRKRGEAVQIVSDAEEDTTGDEGSISNDSEHDDDSRVDQVDHHSSGSISELDSDGEEGRAELEEEEDEEGDEEDETVIEGSNEEGEDGHVEDIAVPETQIDCDKDGIEGTEIPEETAIEDAELDPEINESDEAQDVNVTDPFIQHFEREMVENLQKELKKDKPQVYHRTFTWPVLEKFTFTGLGEPSDDDAFSDTQKISVALLDSENMPKIKVPDSPETPMKNPNLNSLYIKSQLHATLPLVNQANIDKASCPGPLTALQTELIDLASRYHDVYFPMRTISNAEEIRLVYCIHAANHILKTRTRILHHNAKMANKSEVPEAYRDQGFVRPKILILAPFKDSALRILKTITSLILKEEKGNVANSNRFLEEYGGQTLFMPKTNPKPEDYMETFRGNVEDNFKIGMAVTKKSIKLYTGFYSSDIIISSPLGLRMIIGAEGEKDRDYDFLSSIEMLILDQADVFLMQNWDHVLHIMRHLHLQPVTTHGTDFARIRPWALDGLSKFYCQTLMFSSVPCPEHSSLMSKYCKNFAGQARMLQTDLKGSIGHVTVQLPQIFQSFDTASVHTVDDSRFEYFTKHVLPNFKEKLMSHTLIFVSSYFDFVRIRNYFKREEVSFVQICEYTKDKKIARARDLFFHGSNQLLLYTERAHFFRRFRLKGIGHIIFYQLPQNPQFYPELCNLIQEGFQNRRVRQRKNSSVNVIYCKYDAPRLATIVGTERASYMLNSEKKVHAFVSGEL